MLLGLVVSISIIVLPNNISAVIRALNTDEDNRTGQDVPHFQVGENPYKIAIDTSDDIVYVANKLSDTVSVIDTNTMKAPKNIPVGDGPVDIEVDEDENIAYVANKLSDTVSVIDTNTMEVSNVTVADELSELDIELAHGLYVVIEASDKVSMYPTGFFDGVPSLFY
jgi:YVTN family beta-propeller protein